MKKSYLLPLLTLLSLSSVQAADKPVITVYTYDSLVAEWGSGPKLEAAFEKTCGCDLRFVAAEDGVSILNRLKVEGDKAKADVILGIDNGLMEEARATKLIAEHGQVLEKLSASLKWEDKDFLPYDYGYFAFIYDSSKIAKPVSSLKELVESDAKLIYQDPRTSTPGQGLMLWMKAVYGEQTASAWQQLAKHTVTVTKGWWEAYSMFLEGGADYVLSYNTSPAYHMISDKKEQYKAVLFSEGHVAQVELAALLKSSQHPELGKQFLSFLISPEAQGIIPVTNWMLPVVDGIELPPVFSQLIQPQRIGFTATEIAEQRADWIKEWRSAASK
ncbi:thiamine ABC transporter substrate binding subunit [uncultured Thiothrix sp.]|uniref:thiamine ABC transporter substrate binding subunit n=1 Tax=uncultured Thiothrix sp. TaxID=223185 RepID=UPI00262C4868|nr:thiamine ABC transporter substrate binding subunit [uncultured Thiothrix sp.]HMT93447.1 thiamine ABC transporter substrate binding subunit [Thiolinea sp.]